MGVCISKPEGCVGLKGKKRSRRRRKRHIRRKVSLPNGGSLQRIDGSTPASDCRSLSVNGQGGTFPRPSPSRMVISYFVSAVSKLGLP